MRRLEGNRLFRRFYLCFVVRKPSGFKTAYQGRTMKKLSIAVILLTLCLAVFGCQEDKKAAYADLWSKDQPRLASASAGHPTFRNEFRFLENEQLYYGMEAERSRMAQSKAGGKLYSMNSATAVTAKNSY